MVMNPNEFLHRDEKRKRMHRLFEAFFFAESSKRKERKGMSNEGEVEWVALEREAMLGKINELRAEVDKKPLDEDRYKRMEQKAIGHSDYARKLCLYSMELVLEED